MCLLSIRLWALALDSEAFCVRSVASRADCPARSRSEAWVFGPTEEQRRSLAKSFAAEVFISLHKLCKSCRFGACRLARSTQRPVTRPDLGVIRSRNRAFPWPVLCQSDRKSLQGLYTQFHTGFEQNQTLRSQYSCNIAAEAYSTDLAGYRFTKLQAP